MAYGGEETRSGQGMFIHRNGSFFLSLFSRKVEGRKVRGNSDRQGTGEKFIFGQGLG